MSSRWTQQLIQRGVKLRKLRKPAATHLKMQQGIRKHGMESFKKGTHPQMWRKTKHGGAFSKLGPLRALGNSVIYEININGGNLNLFIASGVKLTSTLILKYAKDILYDPITKRMIININTWVPSKSNALRESMLKSITSSGASIPPLIVTLNTEGIDYGGPVNQMPTKNLQHDIDPKAHTQWFNAVRKFARAHAKKEFQKLLKKVSKKIDATSLMNIRKKLRKPRLKAHDVAKMLFTNKFK